MKIIMYIDTFCRYNYIAEFTSQGKQAWINKPSEGGTPNKGRCPTKIPQQITKRNLNAQKCNESLVEMRQVRQSVILPSRRRVSRVEAENKPIVEGALKRGQTKAWAAMVEVGLEGISNGMRK